MNTKDRFIEIQAHKDLKATLCDFGASVYQLEYRGAPMLYVKDRDSFSRFNPEYFGQFVAPVAGRIANGKLAGFTLPQNEGTTCLHSASLVLCWKLFERNVEELSDRVEVTYSLTSDFLGTPYQAMARYRFFRDAPTMEMELTVAAGGKMLANPTNHMYFRLGEEDIANLTLRANADMMMRYDEHNIPLGYKPCPEGIDFTAGAKVTMYLDNAFHVNGGAFTLEGSRYAMDVASNVEHLILYTDFPSRMALGHSAGLAMEWERHTAMGEELVLEKGERETLKATFAFRSL